MATKGEPWALAMIRRDFPSLPTFYHAHSLPSPGPGQLPLHSPNRAPPASSCKKLLARKSHRAQPGHTYLRHYFAHSGSQTQQDGVTEDYFLTEGGLVWCLSHGLGVFPGLLLLSLLPAFAQQRSCPLPRPLTPCSPSTRPSAAEGPLTDCVFPKFVC